jgi:PPOX class probable F420-dependent enzyme
VNELSDEVVEFLSEGTRTGMVGYTAADGRPLVAPVWFLVEDDQIVFATGETTAKSRALARDPRVVFCADDPTPPFSFIQIQGSAAISSGPEELLDICTRLGGRYMGQDRAQEYGQRNGVPGEIIVRIRPTKVIAAFNLAD